MIEPPISRSATDQLPGGERGPDAVLVTVHGTCARGASWAKPDSIMARALVDWFTHRGEVATVMPFDWSGRNSIAARRTAGASLVKCLERIHHQHPEAALYVIAHSHGGSVFGYSIKMHPEIVDLIDGFVALATPWVGVTPCSYAGALRKMLGMLALYAAYAASLPVLVALMYRGLAYYYPYYYPASTQPAPSLNVLGPLSQIVQIVMLSFYAAAAIGALFFLVQRLVSKRLDRTTDAFQRQLANAAQQLNTLIERLPPTVFLKPIGDEAALALTWGSAMAALMQGASVLLFYLLQSARDVWTRIPPTSRSIGGLVFTVFWSAGTAELVAWAKRSITIGTVNWHDLLPSWSAYSTHWDLFAYFLAQPISKTVAVLSWSFIFLLGFGFLLVLFIAFLAAVGAGITSLKAALYFRIAIEPTPAGNHQLDLVDTSPSSTPGSSRIAFGGLKHSALYNTPGAIDAVIEALTAFENARRRHSAREQN